MSEPKANSTRSTAWAPEFPNVLALVDRVGLQQANHMLGVTNVSDMINKGKVKRVTELAAETALAKLPPLDAPPPPAPPAPPAPELSPEIAQLRAELQYLREQVARVRGVPQVEHVRRYWCPQHPASLSATSMKKDTHYIEWTVTDGVPEVLNGGFREIVK